MEWVYDDGGREAAGYLGKTGDCVTRAIAIATQTPYQEVYEALAVHCQQERLIKRRRPSPRQGVFKAAYRPYLEAKGWHWVPTMKIGTGCRVHLRTEELPSGRLIVRLSGHLAAIIDGVVHDTYREDRNGTRCVYGYWKQE